MSTAALDLASRLAASLGFSSLEQADAALGANPGVVRSKAKAPIVVSYAPASKLTKRQAAINAVFYDVARTGSYGAASFRATSAGRLSHETMKAAGALGMVHRAGCKNAACPCKAAE